MRLYFENSQRPYREFIAFIEKVFDANLVMSKYLYNIYDKD